MTSPTSSFGATRHGRTRGDASWINDNSTQMPVWLTMNARDARRADAAHAAGHATRDAAISLVVVMAIVLCACANLIDVYGSAGSWARAAIPAALLGSGIAFMTLVPRLRFWWQILASVLAQCVIGPLVALPHTSVAYVLPTWQTLAEGCSAMFTSFKFLIAVPAPTGTADGSLMAVWTLCLLSCTLGGVLAVLPQRRWSALSVLVVIGDFAVCALLGTSAGVLRLPCGVVCALAAVVWLSWRWRLFEMSRWLGAGALLLLAGAVAVGACLPVHATRTILRDHYEPPLAPFDYASPMSGMRAYLKEHKADTLLTVRNLPAGASVRLAVMDRFDGNVWNLSNTRIAGASSNYTRMGLRITQDGDDSGTWFTAMFDVRDGMRDDWLPLAGAATQVTFATNANADDFYYNTGTESGLLTSGVRSGLAYTETGTLARRPSDDEIRQTQAARIALPDAGDIPNAVRRMAEAFAGGQPTAGAAALALANGLRDNGWFSHGLVDDYPSLAGHGNYRITQLLGGTAMVGDSEQYASAMALMARSLGIPSRVVLGFVPKDEHGDITEARTQRTENGTTTDFTGNDIEAWVEVALEGHGWVAFHPTPQETKTPEDNQNPTPPNPQTLVRQPPLPLTDPLRDKQEATGSTVLSGDDAQDPRTSGVWSKIGAVTRDVAIYGSPRVDSPCHLRLHSCGQGGAAHAIAQEWQHESPCGVRLAFTHAIRDAKRHSRARHTP
ncbi:transglutaminase [Bifidobacterium animalis subsp. lactis]|nr:transglutaminase-like domain-containing protein [Bifidobacterium animalis]OJS85181.1 transglutaminase [Bifidobacterium animalis subsp. lactis]